MKSERPLVVFMLILGVLAVAGMITGAVLAANNYSSAGAFSIAAACVGVLGTLAGEEWNDQRHQPGEKEHED
jgi:uncharacterized membrane protein